MHEITRTVSPNLAFSTGNVFQNVLTLFWIKLYGLKKVLIKKKFKHQTPFMNPISTPSKNVRE